MFKIEFINWNESNSGIAVHTMDEDILVLDIDPDKITGIDYFSQESRQAKVKVFNDNSSFLDQIITGNPVSIDFGYYKRLWNYAVRVYRNNIVIYTGWVKIDSIKYDLKEDTIDFKLTDSMAIIKNYGEESVEYSESSNDYIQFLEQTIQGKNQLVTDQFGLTINSNYSLEFGVPVDETIITVSDSQFGAWGSWGLFTNGGVIYSQNGRRISQNQDGTLRYSLYQYLKSVETFTYSPDEADNEYICTESMKGIHYKISNNVVTEIEYTYNNSVMFGQTEYVDHDFYLLFVNTTSWMSDSRSVWSNSSSAGGGFSSTDSSFPVTFGNDTYYSDSSTRDLMIVGTIEFVNINLKEGEYSYIDLIKMMLILNNLALIFDNKGNIEIINKDQSEITISIPDEDVIEFKKEFVLSKTPDYTSILSPLQEDEIPVLAESLQDFYNDLLPDADYKITIVKDADIEIGTNINILHNTLIVNSVELDNDDFLYILKGWK
jgi:hypothetical protein